MKTDDGRLQKNKGFCTLSDYITATGLTATSTPANSRHLPNAGLMLDQRRRRWFNITPALVEYLLLAGTRSGLDVRQQSQMLINIAQTSRFFPRVLQIKEVFHHKSEFVVVLEKFVVVKSSAYYT